MKKVPMINKALGYYGTRRLRAGQPFDANPEDAPLLEILGQATYPPKPVKAKPEPVAPKVVQPPAASDDEMTTLRAEYEVKFGLAPDKRWGASRLRQALAATEEGSEE